MRCYFPQPGNSVARRLAPLCFLLFFPIYHLPAVPEKPCAARAIQALEAHDPDGYAVYKAVGDEAFVPWLNCSAPPYGLSLAVHESVHRMARDDLGSHSYYLPGGGWQRLPRKNLFNRSLVVAHLAPPDKDTYYALYLTGPMGQQDIVMLLEELNAYTHAAISDVKLVGLMPARSKGSGRDGLASLMYYLELYLREARLQHESDYNVIRSSSDYLRVIKAMWENAEEALLKTAPYPNLGIYDRYKLKQVYNAKNLEEIKLLFDGSSSPVAFRGEIVSRFKLTNDLARNEIPPTNSAEMLPAGAKKTTVFQITINGKAYTCESLTAAAATDSNLAGLLGPLKAQGVCK